MPPTAQKKISWRKWLYFTLASLMLPFCFSSSLRDYVRYHYITPSPFESIRQVKALSNSSPISATKALQTLCDYLLKHSPQSYEELSPFCLVFNEQQEYFFPFRHLSKEKASRHYITKRGVYVHAQTGAIRLVTEPSIKLLRMRKDVRDYHVLWGEEPSTKQVYSARNQEELREAKQKLHPYLQEHYPALLDLPHPHCGRLGFETKEGGEFFFPLQAASPKGRLIGFKVQKSTGHISLICKPLQFWELAPSTSKKQ